MNLPTLARLLFLLIFMFSCKQDPSCDTSIDPSCGNTSDPSNPSGPTDPSSPSDPQTPSPTMNVYSPLGVGGGGAMSGIAISPYNDLWFVGTDMGTLFRSIDKGVTWNPVNHYQADFDSRLEFAVSPGFLADGITIFHASAGVNPKRSVDSGINFQSINMGLSNGERIRYWSEDTQNENVIFAATTKGLLKSNDKGLSWQRTPISSEARGTYIDHKNGVTTIYHATSDKIFISTDEAQSFSTYYNPSTSIRLFTGGRDAQGLTLSFGDDDGANACVWAYAYAAEEGNSAVNNTIDNCGYVWVMKNTGTFSKTSQTVGDHLKMAENDSQTLYTTGGKLWMRQYGTKVNISEDAGSNWNLKLLQLNWDTQPFEPWPQAKIEYSAIALDVGWWDNGYESFAINKKNSSIVAGSGFFFLHSSNNKGNYWDAPFTEMVDTGFPTYDKKWKTQGIEVISVYNIKHHPVNKSLIYAATADIGGMVSTDNGETFRLCKAQYNSNYDYAFDPVDDQVVYAASGNIHDFPVDWHAMPLSSDGGIYKSDDRGLNWSRLTPSNNTWNIQFLSVAFDANRNTLYAGTQSIGLARSTNGGVSWNWFNSGLPSGDKIIPQIEIDPDNGNIYALVTGNYGTWSNRKKTGVYFLDVVNGATSWQLLRGTVHYPPDADSGYKLWWYPTRFAVDFKDPQRSTLWLADYENNGNWLMTGIWKTTDRGDNWNRKVQLTKPTGITIDPNDPDTVFVSGFHQLDGNWGNGGQVYTTDGGVTWKKNLTPNLQHNAFNSMIDPNNPDNMFYTYFGGGILKGPNPSRQPANVEVENVD